MISYGSLSEIYIPQLFPYKGGVVIRPEHLGRSGERKLVPWYRTGERNLYLLENINLCHPSTCHLPALLMLQNSLFGQLKNKVSNRQTDRLTSSLLELLVAAKNISLNGVKIKEW